MRRVTPFLWYGSKTPIIETLLSLLPPHTTYVEPFGGSAAVLLVKQPSSVEVYNDRDHRLCDFFMPAEGSCQGPGLTVSPRTYPRIPAPSMRTTFADSTRSLMR